MMSQAVHCLDETDACSRRRAECSVEEDDSRCQRFAIWSEGHCHHHPLVHQAMLLLTTAQIPHYSILADATCRNELVVTAHVDCYDFARPTLHGLDAGSARGGPLVSVTAPFPHEECPLVGAACPTIQLYGDGMDLTVAFKFVKQLPGVDVPQASSLVLIARCEEGAISKIDRVYPARAVDRLHEGPTWAPLAMLQTFAFDL
eukprot:5881542-Prymnesium_polylepis.3